MDKLVGYRKAQGDFEDEKTGRVISYDNIELIIMSDSVKDVVGCGFYILKIKRERFSDVTGVSVLDLDSFIDSLIQTSYNVDMKGRPVLSEVRLIKAV